MCADKQGPVASLPAHWAPNDLLIYTGNAFPAACQGGAFVAFHGSWNRAPEPQAPANVTFQAFSGGKPSGDFEVFAKGFAKEPLTDLANATYRADGVEQAPDGSLFISESQKGRIWRVMYQAK